MIKSGRLLSAWNTTGVLPGLLFLPFRFQCFTGFEECGNVSRMTLCFIFILRRQRQVWIFSWLGLVSWGSLDANLVGTETRFLDMGEDVHSRMALTSNQEKLAMALPDVCAEVQQNLAVAMNVNIPPTPPTPPTHPPTHHPTTQPMVTSSETFFASANPYGWPIMLHLTNKRNTTRIHMQPLQKPLQEHLQY